MTLTATKALEAWDKKREKQDFNHLGAILSDSFNFVESNGHTQEKSETQEWATTGIICIGDFQII
jgi:Zn-dependent M32 family carboxypeptidase